MRRETDICSCGCGNPRLYSIGLTRNEAEALLRILRYWPNRSSYGRRVQRKIARALSSDWGWDR